MNWYKKAQKTNNEWKWQNLIKSFGATFLLGFAAWVGLSIIEIKTKYIQNPEQVEIKITEYQNQKAQQPIKETPKPLNNNIQKDYNNDFSSQEISKMIEKHEGKRNKVYQDSRGIPTIGIGFNLNRNDARKKIKDIGANYDNIIKGSESLTDQQIYSLFNISLNEAINTAQNFIPNFNQYPSQVQLVVVNMAFNLGPNKLKKFKNFRKALMQKDYQEASNEMINSQWYNQVGNRSKELVDIMKNRK